MNPKPNQELIKLSDLCWQFRRDEGYLKPLPAEYKKQALEFLLSGTKASDIAKYLGVPAHSLKDWRKSFESKKIELQAQSEKNYFTEVKVESDLSTTKSVDKSAISVVFQKNGVRFEIKNLSSTELIQIIGMS